MTSNKSYDFFLEFKGLKAKVSITYWEGLKIYCLEWPDDSMDYLFQENDMWKSYTLKNTTQINILGNEITKTLN